jgi:hypothetical protein
MLPGGRGNQLHQATALRQLTIPQFLRQQKSLLTSDDVVQFDPDVNLACKAVPAVTLTSHLSTAPPPRSLRGVHLAAAARRSSWQARDERLGRGPTARREAKEGCGGGVRANCEEWMRAIAAAQEEVERSSAVISFGTTGLVDARGNAVQLNANAFV